jgi:hypothetical protein
MLSTSVLFGGKHSILFFGARSRPYRISSYSFQTTGTEWFVIFGGAIQGITAALLWSAQGEIMMSYPLEKDKGKMFGIFWGMVVCYFQSEQHSLTLNKT